ncbi:MAG: SCO family protein [Candidatus Bathyarchaeia archaeon]
MASRKITVISVVVAVLVVAASLLVYQGYYGGYSEHTLSGFVPTSPREAADFTLTDHNGNKFTLSSTRGQVVLLYFGYTHCPDACPATLANYRWLQEGLVPAAPVTYVMVTVDPARDTPETLNKFIEKFGINAVGLTGSHEELAPVWSMYGIAVEIEDEQGSHHEADESEYTVGHVTLIYLIDKKGYIRTMYPLGVFNEDIRSDIEALLRER